MKKLFLFLLVFMNVCLAFNLEAQTVIKMPIAGNPNFSVTVQETGISGIVSNNGHAKTSSLDKHERTWFWKEGEETFHYVHVYYSDETTEKPKSIYVISFKKSDIAKSEVTYSAKDGPVEGSDFYGNKKASNILIFHFASSPNPFNIVGYERNSEVHYSNPIQLTMDLPATDRKKTLSMVRDIYDLRPLETVLDDAVIGDVIKELCINRYEGHLVSTAITPKGKTQLSEIYLSFVQRNADIRVITLDKENIAKITVDSNKNSSGYYVMTISFRKEQKIFKYSFQDSKYIEEGVKKQFDLRFCSQEEAEKFKKEIGEQAENNAKFANIIDAASGDSPLIKAFKAKDYAEASELITDGADLIYKNPKTGFSTLRYAIDSDDNESIKKIMESPAMSGEILEKNLSDIKDDFLYAMDNGKLEAVRIMVGPGRRKYMFPSSKGYYPAMLAYQAGNLELCRMFLWLYSEAYKGDYTSYQQQSVNEKMTVLMMAVEKNDLKAIKFLELLEKDRKPELMDKDGYTAMMLASEKGYKEIIEWAIEKQYQRIWKFKSTQGKMEGKTPIDVAKTNEIKKLIKIASEK